MIKIYTLNHAKEWDQIVKSFHDYDVYYLSGYVRAFHINGDGEPILLYFSSSGTRAVNVIFKRDISDSDFFKNRIEPDTFFDLITPYGYGGFLVEGTDYISLESEYLEFCHNEHIICEFVRFHPLLRNWKRLESLYTTDHLGDTVYINTENEELIWKNMTSKNRNMVRKAQKNGLSVYWGRDHELILPFMEIYNATMDRDSAAAYYYFGKNFYESILEDLKQNSMWFYVKKDGQIIAMAIFLFCNGKMHYHLSASRKEFQNLAPTNLLLYEAALWAANHGYQTLHMGGGVGLRHDSLYAFKKAFNRGDDLNYYIGKRIFDKDKYNYLVQQRISADPSFNIQTGFFPLYRA